MAIEFHRGETVKTKGVTTPILSAENKAKEIKIFDYYDSKIESCDETIEKNKEIIEENKTLWSLAKELIKKAKHERQSILSKAQVNHYSKINDPTLKKEYLSLTNDISSNKLAQIKASSAILTAAIDTGSACSSKMNAIGQKMVTQHVINSYS